MAMDLTMAIFHAEITVLDYESTGSLRGFANEPWQIGMVSLKNGKVDPVSMFESLLRVDVNRPFNPHAPGRHSMLRDQIAVAPTPEELWMQVRSRLTGYPLCAHNVATEKKFTRLMAPMHKFGQWIDTLRIARKVWPGCPSYALEDLVVLLDLKLRVDDLCPGKEAHDALYDAVASAMLLEHLFEQPGWGNVTVGELASM
ncbi:3'-5' exonuclease [Pontiella sulfatireligans]|uniref:Exodeoxyribonuclease 10 n=1 Tax=Pontiella sulfatireligans TaxID=2750658 RepID=A0A6C2UL99_9BACT|nr:3'-5' exonuclease [Pontiella sulfatireligans]VGO21015.1 Exodeoxyribonuclease 10 [Pontiella sulfatireligans]